MDFKRSLFQDLKKFNLSPKKSLGQNFLLNKEVLEKIADIANISHNDHVLEIGPGPGTLTEEILQKSPQTLTCLEIDKDFEKLLNEKLNINDDYIVINENALKYTPKYNNYILMGNIPYYISSPLMRHYLTQNNKAKIIVFMIQKEFAQKICSKKESVLSLQVKIYGTPEIISYVRKEDFYPAPKVDSAILKITTHKQALINQNLINEAWRIIKIAFSQKRKKISNSIGNTIHKTSNKPFIEIIRKSKIKEDSRHESLSIAEWEELAKISLQNH